MPTSGVDVALAPWRAMLSESVVVSSVRRLVRRAMPRGPERPDFTPARRLDVSGSPASDERLIRVADAGLPIRSLTRGGQRLLVAWADSSAGRLLAEWRAIAADTRIRLIAVVLMVAAITHIVMTGFAAPEATLGARAAWVVVLAVLALTAVEARGVEAAWVEWKARHSGRAHENL